MIFDGVMESLERKTHFDDVYIVQDVGMNRNLTRVLN